MKILIINLILATFAFAVDTYPSLSTKKGREYTAVTVLAAEPDGIRIRHESGTAKIPFADLPLEIQRKYNYDPVAAEQYKKESEARSNAQEAALDEEISKVKKLAPREIIKPAPADANRQTPASKNAAPPTDVTLNAATSAMGRNGGTYWTTSWGSYDKSIFRGRVVSVTVRAATSGDCILELHWIGSQPGKASNQGVVKVDRKPVTLVANRPVTHEFGSLFVENDTKYAALGERNRDGCKYAGWVARVVSKDGVPLAVQGARPPMVQMVK
jgi:hypothetical protein